MRIYDISQEVFSCNIYPGDPTPKKNVLSSIVEGNLYNLTEFSMCAHNGTHIDVPFHFLQDGKTIEQMELGVFVGNCFVVRCQGELGREEAQQIMNKADGAQRILIAGDATVTASAAEVFAAHNIKLIGNEAQTVGPADAPMQVHKILLGAGIALLEGVVLTDISEGKYFLCAAPLKLAGSDGAPCRAFLLEMSYDLTKGSKI